MLREACSVRPARPDDDPRRDRERVPAARSRTICRIKRAFSVDLSDQLIDVDDVGLELDHEDRATAGMPGDDVDDTTFAVDGVGDLGGQDPGGELAGEPARDRARGAGVLRVEQAVEVSSAPPRYEIDTDVERRRDPADQVQRERSRMTPLEPRDRRWRYAGLRRQVRLAPTTANADRPDRPPRSRWSSIQRVCRSTLSAQLSGRTFTRGPLCHVVEPEWGDLGDISSQGEILAARSGDTGLP